MRIHLACAMLAAFPITIDASAGERPSAFIAQVTPGAGGATRHTPRVEQARPAIRRRSDASSGPGLGVAAELQMKNPASGVVYVGSAGSRDHGDGNQLDHVQWGDGNRLVLSQQGRNGTITGMQAGTGNIAEISQRGSFNRVTFHQSGTANYIRISQD